MKLSYTCARQRNGIGSKAKASGSNAKATHPLGKTQQTLTATASAEEKNSPGQEQHRCGRLGNHKELTCQSVNRELSGVLLAGSYLTAANLAT